MLNAAPSVLYEPWTTLAYNNPHVTDARTCLRNLLYPKNFEGRLSSSPELPRMCHQLIRIFECGHNTGSTVVKCKRPTDECIEVFLRQELEDVSRPCAVQISSTNTETLLTFEVMSQKRAQPKNKPDSDRRQR